LFDHLTLRVPDLADATRVFEALFSALRVGQTVDRPTFAMWQDFGVSAVADDRPATTGAHVAFVAPDRDSVDRFWQAGIDQELTDDGAAGPRQQYSDTYYGAFLRDAQGNSLEAVHRDGLREDGLVDHVALRVADLAAATAFYETAAPAAGFTLARAGANRATFTGGAGGGVLSLVHATPTEPPTQHVHAAFPGDNAAVDRFHADAVAAGYTSNGGPGYRGDGEGYYAAFVLDPDGNNIEVVNRVT
jgi:catechol 2,3-dioxygenase-like lactoylglutathione lyase family enzyme